MERHNWEYLGIIRGRFADGHCGQLSGFRDIPGIFDYNTRISQTYPIPAYTDFKILVLGIEKGLIQYSILVPILGIYIWILIRGIPILKNQIWAVICSSREQPWDSRPPVSILCDPIVYQQKLPWRLGYIFIVKVAFHTKSHLNGNVRLAKGLLFEKWFYQQEQPKRAIPFLLANASSVLCFKVQHFCHKNRSSAIIITLPYVQETYIAMVPIKKQFLNLFPDPIYLDFFLSYRFLL